LGDLAKLSAKLATTWDWDLAHATEFVLCDSVPPRPAIRGVTFSATNGWDNRYGSYHWPYVRLTIDAQVTPEELAAWWRTERQAMGIAGTRPLADESVELGLFAVRQDDSTTFREDCDEWNSLAIGKRFDSWRNYRTAAKRAVERLNMPVGRIRSS
jgi:hypothetical protein